MGQQTQAPVNIFGGYEDYVTVLVPFRTAAMRGASVVEERNCPSFNQ